MKIGVDFDRTIFDTDSFNKLYNSSIEGLEHIEDPSPMRNGVYDPELHAEICNIDPSKIWDFMDQDLGRFVYDDIDILKELDHELVIVTRGHEKLQRNKIKSSGVMDFFSDFVVVQEEPKDKIDIDILIDDREEELERVDVPGILINRPKNDLKAVVEKVEDIET